MGAIVPDHVVGVLLLALVTKLLWMLAKHIKDEDESTFEAFSMLPVAALGLAILGCMCAMPVYLVFMLVFYVAPEVGTWVMGVL